MAGLALRSTHPLTLPIFLSALLFSLLAGCQGPAKPPEARDTVRIPIPTDPAEFSFARAHEIWSLVLTEYIGDSLVSYDDQLAIQPRIASSWEWTDAGTTLVFHLRQDMAWHDGLPVTSTDVLYTVKVMQDPKLATTSRAAAFQEISGVRAPDRYTVEVKYDRPFAPALAGWTAPILPAHRDLEDEEHIGCGPWIFDRWETGERIVLRANHEHAISPPLLEGLEFEVISDYSTRYAALRAGRIDVCPLLPKQHDALDADAELSTRYKVVSYRLLYFFYLAWQGAGEDSLFEDPRVRRAMTHAMDRRGLIDRFFSGRGTVGITTFHPDTWAFDDSIDPWPYDPERARELLSEAGFRDSDGDGVLDRDGRPFRFTLLISQSSKYNEMIATLIQSELAKIGVEVKIEAHEFAVFLDRIRSRDFEAMLSGWHLDLEPDPFELWHSSQALKGPNYAGLQDAKIDEWIEAAREEFDLTRRRGIYSKIQKRLHELEPETIFFYPTSSMAYDARIEGFEAGPAGPFRSSPGPCAWHWISSPALAD